MAMRLYVCRLFIRQSNHICQKHYASSVSTLNPPPIPNSHRQNAKKQTRHNAAFEKDDPDVFGTLASRKGHFTVQPEPLVEQFVDEGDMLEEKYLSFQPKDRKSVETCEKEIDQLLKERRLKDALHLLEVTMKEDKIKPSREIYSMLLGACGRAGYTKKAFSLYNQMKKRGHTPADSHYTSLFNSCANSPWPEDGLQRASYLREQLKSNNTLLNTTQYHAMMKAFGRCGEIQTTFEILDEMMTNRLPVTTETFNFLLQACITSREKGYSQALMVWRQMRNIRVTPSVYSYNLILRATRDCGVGDVRTKEAAIDSILKIKGGNNEVPAISPPSESDLPTLSKSVEYPNLLAGKIASNNVMAVTNLEQPENRLALVGGIEGFLKEMRNDHNHPDIKTFSLLLETIKSDTNEEKVLMEAMKYYKVTPDVDFFNLLIKKRQFREDNSGAKEVLNLLQEYQLFPNIMTFGVLAIGCRKLSMAKELIEDMDAAGFRINIEIFGVLLKNAIWHRDCFFIIELLDHAAKINLALDKRAIQLLHKFKEETTEMMAKHDRGENVKDLYGRENFRYSFGIFCKRFRPVMEQLEAAIDPHPWQQYRYPLAKKKSTEPSSLPTNFARTNQ